MLLGVSVATAVVIALVSQAYSLGPIQPMSRVAGPRSGEPRLTAGPGGSLAMSWLEERRPRGHRLRWASWDGRWSKTVTIAEGDSFFVNWADFPSLRWLGGNRWVAHWLWRSGKDTYAYQVRLSFSEDGGRTWGKPVVPHRDGTPTEHGFVTITPEAGNARVVWLDGRNFAGHGTHDEPGPEMTVRTAVVTADGQIQLEMELDGRACDCCATAAASTASGALVAYRDRSATEIRDISVVRLEQQGWTTPITLHADGWKIAGCPVNGPAMVASGDHVAIAWFTAADSPRVSTAWSTDGGKTFTAPVRTDAGEPIGRVGVALLSDSSVFVTWLEGGKAGATILGRRMTLQGDLGPTLTIARTSAARASGFPQVERVGNELFFAWTETGKVPEIRTARMSMGKALDRK